MRVLVCGGRDYNNVAHIWRTLDKLHEETPITAMIQGGATGADTIANDWAKTKPRIERYVSKVKKEDWKKLGPAAGPIRNARMLEWKPDLVVAFTGGRGTKDMVTRARAAGIPVREIT